MQEISFDTRPKKNPSPEDDDRDTIVVPINGEEYFAFRPHPNDIALFFASLGKGTAYGFAGVQEFLRETLEPEAMQLLMDAVKSKALDYSELIKLAKEIIKEFSENPTGPSAGSTPSRARSGSDSTATSRRPASTRASSRRPASSD